MSSREAAFAFLELAFNRYLRLGPNALQRLAALHGRVILLEIQGLGLRIYCVPGRDGVQLYPRFEAQPDCILSGTPLGFARLANSGEQADELFKGAVEVRGDTEVGHRFGDILADLDIDWEEQLARLTGDLTAHSVGRHARSAKRWGEGTMDTLALDLREYLQEEARLLPCRWEAEEFSTHVDTLRDDLDRLSARLARLERRLDEKDDG